MGQLEKYGLYVLCLVIFLILGVTIWGGGDLPPSRQVGARAGSDLQAPAPGRTGGTGAAPADAGAANRVPTLAPDLDALFRPTDRKAAPTPAKPPETPTSAGKPVDASGSPAAAPAESSARPVHKIQRGDSFDSIARKVLGNAALQTEIVRLNPRVEPRRLTVGQEILLPTKAEIDRILAGDTAAPAAAGTAPKDAKDAAPTPKTKGDKKAGPTTYVVAKGDTFEGIARRQLGSGARVDELRELNPTVDPTRLKVGQKIQLPAK